MSFVRREKERKRHPLELKKEKIGKRNENVYYRENDPLFLMCKSLLSHTNMRLYMCNVRRETF